MRRAWLLWLPVLALATLLAVGGPAFAHKIKLFATAQGTIISGTAYVPGGGRIAGAKVTARAPDGDILTTALTDEKGAFVLEATRRVDHLLELNTGDGHRATFRIAANQLAATLPPSEDASQSATPAAATTAKPPTAAPVSSLSEEALEALVARAVASQINPLRAQLEAHEERLRVHDILGGLGWIMGLAGLAFFLLGRREQRGSGR